MALGDPLVAREERIRLVNHYPLLPIVEKNSEPAKSCAANATRLQSQEQCSCRTLSNAFDRSMKVAVVYCFLS